MVVGNKVKVGNGVFVTMHGGVVEAEVAPYEAALAILNTRTEEIERGASKLGFSSVSAAYTSSNLWFVDLDTNRVMSGDMVRERIAHGIQRLVEKTNQDGSPFLQYGVDFLKVGFSGATDEEFTFVFNKKWFRAILVSLIAPVVANKTLAVWSEAIR